jgi:hypothetical protein
MPNLSQPNIHRLGPFPRPPSPQNVPTLGQFGPILSEQMKMGEDRETEKKWSIVALEI